MGGIIGNQCFHRESSLKRIAQTKCCCDSSCKIFSFSFYFRFQNSDFLFSPTTVWGHKVKKCKWSTKPHLALLLSNNHLLCFLPLLPFMVHLVSGILCRILGGKMKLSGGLYPFPTRKRLNRDYLVYQ